MTDRIYQHGVTSVSEEHPVYPLEPANTFVVHFDPDRFPVAHAIDGGCISQGTKVNCVLVNGKWFIIEVIQ